MFKGWVKLGALCVASAVFAVSASAQDMASFEKRTTVKVLPNGLTLIVCERPEAPVFSYFTMVNAGSANDPGGQSGLAHMFEHMAFKGTHEIGTTDYAAEKVALAQVELTLPQYRVLGILAEGSAAASGLADRLAVRRPSITALIDGLVARGLVDRRQEDADRRRVAVAEMP